MPVEVQAAFHLTRHKSQGNDINRNTRPVMVMSGVARLKGRILQQRWQVIASPRRQGVHQYGAGRATFTNNLRLFM